MWSVKRGASPDVTNYHACHGICTLSPFDAALILRLPKTGHTALLKCCACHANHITSCSGIFKKDRFCRFPYGHGAVWGNSETREETCWSLNFGILCETGSTFHTSSLQNRRFPTSLLTDLKLLPQKRCFVRGLRQHFSEHRTSKNATCSTQIARCSHLTQP